MKWRLQCGLAMVILAFIAMLLGLTFFAILSEESFSDILFDDSYLAYELLMVLGALFLLAFVLCPKERRGDIENGEVTGTVSVNEDRGLVSFRNGPHWKIASVFLLVGLPLSIFGALGVLKGSGIFVLSESGNIGVFGGAVFFGAGALFTYFGIGGLSCWEEVEIGEKDVKIRKVTFFCSTHQAYDKSDIDSIRVVSSYEHRTGNEVELRLEFRNRDPVTILDGISRDVGLSLQDRIASVAEVEKVESREDIDERKENGY